MTKAEKNLRPMLEVIARALMSDMSETDISYSVLKEVCDFLGFDGGFAYMCDLSLGDMLYLQAEVLASPEFNFHKEIGTNVVFDGISRDDEADSSQEILHIPLNAILSSRSREGSEKTGGILAIPIVESERLIGLLGVFSEDDIAYRLSSEERSAVIMALSLVGGYIKARYMRQKNLYVRESLERAIDNTGVDIYVTDFYTNEILYVNKSMAEPYGGPQAMIGRTCYLALYDDKDDECEYCPKYRLIDDEGNPTRLYSWDYKRPFDGSWFRVFSAAFKWEEDRLAHVITSMNITENKRNELLVEHMALNDVLTGIPNRRSFERDFEGVIQRSVRENRTGYILFIDLDNFKYINDAFGHEKGDELLIAVAGYLNSLSSQKQQAYRYGGDEFIIVVEDIELSTVTELVNLLLLRFTESWNLDDLEYFCTASIGIAAFPDGGVTYDVLLNAADKAMYEAKKSGKSAASFSRGSDDRRSNKMEMEFALRRAVLDGCGEFDLLYHPIVNIDTGRWTGVETLIRWNSQQYGIVYPDTFIPICENKGLIFELEKWTLSRAIEEVQTWGVVEEEDFFLSLNVSAMEFHDDGFSEHALSTLDKKSYPHAKLMFEIIEATPNFSLKIREIRERLDFLRAKGLLIALDSFGLGYNSLERIQELAVDFVKIDRKFVTDFMDNELKTAVVRAIVMLAEVAHARVCAEGVESLEHVRRLQRIGCGYVQGLYFSKPAPGPVFKEALLENHRMYTPFL